MKRQPKPACAQCGLETDFLFDGFTAPTKARAKFIEGERIKLSRKGENARFGQRDGKRKATLFSFCKDEEIIRVLWDGNEQPQYYHIDYFVPDKRRGKVPFERKPAKVCQEHRPLSSLEIKELMRTT